MVFYTAFHTGEDEANVIGEFVDDSMDLMEGDVLSPREEEDDERELAGLRLSHHSDPSCPCDMHDVIKEVRDMSEIRDV